MPSTGIDLDVLAAGYRHRPPTVAARQRAREAARRALDPLLDIGGGPGHHVNEWSSMGRRGVLLDLSEAMVRIASQVPHAHVVRSDAQLLPFRTDSFGLAYFHQSIQYGDWRRSLAEAVRVVRPGGRIEVWTFAPADIALSSLARWFPSIAAIDQPRFPEPDDLAAFVGSRGSAVAVDTVDEIIERPASSWIEAVRARFVSSLQVVPDDELEAGLDDFRAQYPHDDDVYRYAVRFTWVSCVV